MWICVIVSNISSDAGFWWNVVAVCGFISHKKCLKDVLNQCRGNPVSLLSTEPTSTLVSVTSVWISVFQSLKVTDLLIIDQLTDLLTVKCCCFFIQPYYHNCDEDDENASVQSCSEGSVGSGCDVERRKFKVDDFVFIGVLGKGNFGKVCVTPVIFLPSRD